MELHDKSMDWFRTNLHRKPFYHYWLVVWNNGILWLSIYWKCHNPNWLTYFGGVGSTTNQIHRGVPVKIFRWKPIQWMINPWDSRGVPIIFFWLPFQLRTGRWPLRRSWRFSRQLWYGRVETTVELWKKNGCVWKWGIHPNLAQCNK